MTFVSLAQATHRLGIDVKTLHRWLCDAQLALQCHPDDGRKKGVSSEHLHQRSLTPLPEESVASEVLAPPELSACGAARHA